MLFARQGGRMRAIYVILVSPSARMCAFYMQYGFPPDCRTSSGTKMYAFYLQYGLPPDCRTSSGTSIVCILPAIWLAARLPDIIWHLKCMHFTCNMACRQITRPHLAPQLCAFYVQYGLPPDCRTSSGTQNVCILRAI